MATVHFKNIKPKERISEKATPEPLRKALVHIFSGISDGLWLVGGTALVGYYAEHRRSDDLDLFAIDAPAHRTAVMAVKSLSQKGALLSGERTTPTYYRANIQVQNHTFTVDVVLVEFLHQIGTAKKTTEGVWVVDLPTLFATKAACLVSRCSEKDLFDLDWMIRQMENFQIADLITAGAEIDGGLTVETLLISMQGAVLRKEACGFVLPSSGVTPAQAYQTISSLRKKLVQLLLEYEKKMTPPSEVKALSQVIRDSKKK